MIKSASRVAEQLVSLAYDMQDIERVHVWDLTKHLEDFSNRYTNIVFAMNYIQREKKCDDGMFEFLVERLESVTDELDCIKDNIRNNTLANRRMQAEITLLLSELDYLHTQDALDKINNLLDYMLESVDVEWDDQTIGLSNILCGNCHKK